MVKRLKNLKVTKMTREEKLEAIIKLFIELDSKGKEDDKVISAKDIGGMLLLDGENECNMYFVYHGECLMAVSYCATDARALCKEDGTYRCKEIKVNR